MNVVVVKKVRCSFTQRQIQTLLEKIIADLMRFRKLKKHVRTRLASAQELTVVFAGAMVSRKLNFKYRSRDYATDVLSFASSEESSLGDLVFCVPVLQRQARDHQLTMQSEFIYLLIHGILHLLGYDHEKNDSQAQAMYSLQDRIFARLHVHNNRTVRHQKSAKKPTSARL